MGWRESENKAYQWFKTTIDPNAEPVGKSDSTLSDIYSPLYKAYIEIKDITNGARCGQFTKSTMQNNPFAQAIYDGDYSPTTCRKFVQYHYNKKNVAYFIVVDGDDMSFYSFADFFANYTFEVQDPYLKRSGTRSAPKKAHSKLLDMDAEFFLAEDGKIYCYNHNRWRNYVSVYGDSDYIISKDTGELRVRGKTINMTWHLLIKKS